MSEPDFEQIANACLAAQGVYEDFLGETAIVEALRQVWNARGAADMNVVDESWDEGEATHGELCRKIKELDR